VILLYLTHVDHPDDNLFPLLLFCQVLQQCPGPHLCILIRRLAHLNDTMVGGHPTLAKPTQEPDSMVCLRHPGRPDTKCLLDLGLLYQDGMLSFMVGALQDYCYCWKPGAVSERHHETPTAGTG
jgi:hypothetical protein